MAGDACGRPQYGVTYRHHIYREGYTRLGLPAPNAAGLVAHCVAMTVGTLILIPNALDFGLDDAARLDIRDVLPAATLVAAARLDHWIVEDAKTARAFLKRVHTVQPLARALQALHIVELPRAPKGRPQATVDPSPLLAPAREGFDIGLLSEAGLPAVADPGAAVVAAAHAAGIRVQVLCGPNALVMALAASGLNGQSFAFAGYLPIDADARAARIRDLEAYSKRGGQTQIVIETPYRNATLLAALLGALQGTTRLSVSCGLTWRDGWTRTDAVTRWRAEPTALPADVPAVFVFQA